LPSSNVGGAIENVATIVINPSLHFSEEIFKGLPLLSCFKGKLVACSMWNLDWSR